MSKKVTQGLACQLPYALYTIKIKMWQRSWAPLSVGAHTINDIKEELWSEEDRVFLIFRKNWRNH